MPGKEGQSTKIATAVIELQKALPMARAVYCSATGVSEVGHMAYMDRMCARCSHSHMRHSMATTVHKSCLVSESVSVLHIVACAPLLTSVCSGPSVELRDAGCRGLWGTGSAFADFEAFIDSMKHRGVSFLEMLAMELKSEGKYVARGLSFRDAEFVHEQCALTQEQVCHAAQSP